MDEAVEICKLRLFLKLVAQVERVEEIEPLPDIDFSIRAGNTLVGFASYQDVLHAITMAGGGQMKMLSDDETAETWATQYNRWREESRSVLFDNLTYAPTVLFERNASIPKVDVAMELRFMRKISSYPAFTQYRATASGSDTVYYHSGGRYFRKCVREQLLNVYKELAVQRGLGDAVIALLSSSLYYWFWIVLSDCYHVTKRDIDALHMPESLSTDGSIKHLAHTLLADLKTNAKIVNRKRADGTERAEMNFDVGKSKPIVDEIDRTLADHYGLTDEELDFIINYDIKYRMGRGADETEK